MSGNCFTFISIVDLFNRIFTTIALLAALPNRLTVMFRATDVHWMGVHSSFTLIHGKHEHAFAREKENYPPAKCNSCKTEVSARDVDRQANSSRLELRRPLNYFHYKRVSLHILARPSRKFPSAWRFMQNASPWFPIKATQLEEPPETRGLRSSVFIERAKDPPCAGKDRRQERRN